MPEGPSIVILKELVKPFEGKKVIHAEGNAKIDFDRLQGLKVKAFRSWGKHFLICFDGFTVRVHLLLFGSYLINEEKAAKIRLGLRFPNGTFNIYAAAVKLLEDNADAIYDWSADVMNDAWDPKKARKKLKEVPEEMVCDALLEQDIFSGVGNIIKNEVLYRIRVHPESRIGALPKKKTDEMLQEAVTYSFEFLEWKKEGTLKKHWLAHSKKKCTRCDLPLHKEVTGKKKRNSFFCTNCQDLYV